jgi:RHS repeat-associated protein
MDTLGRLTKTATINGTSFTTIQDTSSGGRLESLTYPSGRTVTYTQDNLGKLASIATTYAGVTTTLVDDLAYSPFGPATGMNLPTIGAVENQLDKFHRQDISNPNAVDGHGLCDFQYDGNSNLEQIVATNDSRRDQSFEYSALNRLTSATGIHGSLAFTYDKAGNRETKTLDGETGTYAYLSGTNRIDTITGADTTTFDYDANGNTIDMAALSLTYDQDNRLVIARKDGAVVGEYVYNGLGQRVIKSTGDVTTYYHYDFQGNLIAETPPDTVFIDGSEYIYNGPTALATVDIASAEIYYYHVNHLSTPEFITDATGEVVWQAAVKPFGAVVINEASTIDNPLRFPGHYFDAETGLHYNSARYYSPEVGRYLTPDPSGLEGGLNPYAYSLNNPITAYDSNGEFLNCLVGAGTSVALGYGISLLTGESYSWKQVAVDAAMGAVGAGVVNKLSKLRYLRNASQLDDTTAYLQKYTTRAARTVDDLGDGAFTTRQLAAIERNPNLRPPFRGNRIDVRTRQYVRNDNRLSHLTSNYRNGPDFMDPRTGRWWDMTTPAEWAKHVAKYGPNGTLLTTIVTRSTFNPFLSILGGFLGQGVSSAGLHLAQSYYPSIFSSMIGSTIPADYEPLQEGYEYLIWGSTGSGQGQFDGPHGISVSDDGYVYVADYSNYRIQKFDDQGDFISEWGSEGAGPGQFDGITDLTVDSQGLVYVTDRYNHRIQVFNSDGSFDFEWGYDDDIPFQPIGIAVHNDMVYVTRITGFSGASPDHNPILSFNQNGNHLQGWGRRATNYNNYGDLEFYGPMGIFVDVDLNRIYIADHEMEDIRVTDLSGNFIDRWGHYTQSGSDPGEFHRPHDVVVDNQGDVFICDQYNHRIQVFDPDGNYLNSWGTNGSEDEELDFPTYMAIDKHGYIYISDTYNDRIQKVHSSVLK